MVSSWEKNLIAENCEEYKAVMPIMNMRVMANTCTNCANYVDGKCNRESFDNIEKKINFN